MQKKEPLINFSAADSFKCSAGPEHFAQHCLIFAKSTYLAVLLTHIHTHAHTHIRAQTRTQQKRAVSVIAELCFGLFLD